MGAGVKANLVISELGDLDFRRDQYSRSENYEGPCTKVKAIARNAISGKNHVKVNRHFKTFC